MPRHRQSKIVALLLLPVKIASSRLFHTSSPCSVRGAARPILYIAKADTLTKATPLHTPNEEPTHTHKSHTTPRDLHQTKNQAAECNTTNSPLQPDLHWNPFLCVCYLHNNCASSSDFCNFLRTPQWDSFSCFHASTYPHINEIILPLLIIYIWMWPSLLSRLAEIQIVSL